MLTATAQTGAASLAMKRDGLERAFINPNDARHLGIADGQTMRLWNSRGACLAAAQVTGAVRPRVIVLPTGAWFTPNGNDGVEIAGNPNVLTLDIGLSAFGQGCSAQTCLVYVEPYFGEVLVPLDSCRNNWPFWWPPVEASYRSAIADARSAHTSAAWMMQPGARLTASTGRELSMRLVQQERPPSA